MAINLLDSLNTRIPLPGSTTRMQTTTPAAVMQQPKATFSNPTPSPVMPQTSQNTPISMGVIAKNPSTNVKPSSTTLASSQVASGNSGDSGKSPQNPGTYQGDSYISSLGVAKTAEQLAAEHKGATTGIGSRDPTVQTPAPLSYGGILGQLVQNASQPSAQYNQQVDQANQYNQALTRSMQNEATALGQNYSNPIPLEFQQGRGQVLQNQYGMQQQALGAGYQGASNLVNAANTQQGLQQTGLYNAAGLAAPQLSGIGSQQYYNPLTAGASGNGTLPAQSQDFVNSLAQQVQNGQMTRADAESRLQTYGVAGLQALNSALGSGFNTNASNASAATTGQGQQIQTAAQSTNAALDTLTTAFQSLPGLDTGGIPATNSIAQWIGSQLGSQALQQYKTNLADARSQLIGVLNSSGGTPTGNEATANEYLPDNMTKAQFDANVGTQQNPGIVRQLVAQKVNAFTGSGQQNNQSNNGTSSSSNSLYNW